MSYSNFIGVFDSGLGGISVLRALKRYLPHENFIYLADKKNAPYGVKTDEEILRLTRNNVIRLVQMGVKAVVIACNTATSVAAKQLRSELDIPIIGLEPAIKPAVSYAKNGNILVLATEVTLSHPKFTELLATLSVNNVVLAPAPYLVEYVEGGMLEKSRAVDYLRELLSPHKNIKFDACVLGCTHFPFVKEEILSALDYEVVFFDGADGAAKELKRQLILLNLLDKNTRLGNVVWLTKYENNMQELLLCDNKRQIYD